VCINGLSVCDEFGENGIKNLFQNGILHVKIGKTRFRWPVEEARLCASWNGSYVALW